MNCLLTGVNRRDVILIEFARITGAQKKKVQDWDGEGIPVIVGFLDGTAEVQTRCREDGRPYIFIDHGYLHRNAPIYDKFRMCVSHYHLTDFRNSDRPTVMCDEWHGGDEVIVIPPTPIVCDVYRCHDWLKDTLRTLAENTDRRLVVKQKSDGKLKSYLGNAHAVVSFGSVAEVEALLHGVPVFTTCGPALPVAETDFTKIETPIRPEREKWLSALAGAEWHLAEMNLAWERIRCLLPHSQNSKPQ